MTKGIFVKGISAAYSIGITSKLCGTIGKGMLRKVTSWCLEEIGWTAQDLDECAILDTKSNLKWSDFLNEATLEGISDGTRVLLALGLEHHIKETEEDFHSFVEKRAAIFVENAHNAKTMGMVYANKILFENCDMLNFELE